MLGRFVLLRNSRRRYGGIHGMPPTFRVLSLRNNCEMLVAYRGLCSRCASRQCSNTTAFLGSRMIMSHGAGRVAVYLVPPARFPVLFTNHTRPAVGYPTSLALSAFCNHFSRLVNSESRHASHVTLSGKSSCPPHPSCERRNPPRPHNHFSDLVSFSYAFVEL